MIRKVALGSSAQLVESRVCTSDVERLSSRVPKASKVADSVEAKAGALLSVRTRFAVAFRAAAKGCEGAALGSAAVEGVVEPRIFSRKLGSKSSGR